MIAQRFTPVVALLLLACSDSKESAGEEPIGSTGGASSGSGGAGWLGSGGLVGGGMGPGGAASGSGGAPAACDHSLTDYEGDCFALDPPAANEGFQLHYGPDSYDPDAMARFVLAPGAEVVDCLYMTTPNDAEIFYQRHEVTVRHGTHHVIVWADADDRPDGALESCPTSPGVTARWTMWTDGALTSDGGRKVYPDRDLPPEDAGLAYRFGPRSKIGYQAHFVNTGDQPLLRESWANVYFMPEQEVVDVVDTIAFIGGLGMNVPPSTTQVITASCTPPPNAPDELRVLNLTGHMHVHGARFSAWKVAENGARTEIYQAYDWSEPGLAIYSPGYQNPTPDAATRKGGGSSGLLHIGKTERIDYECEIVNNETFALHWANEAYKAEMCNLLGMYTPSTGAPWGCRSF